MAYATITNDDAARYPSLKPRVGETMEVGKYRTVMRDAAKKEGTTENVEKETTPNVANASKPTSAPAKARVAAKKTTKKAAKKTTKKK